MMLRGALLVEMDEESSKPSYIAACKLCGWESEIVTGWATDAADDLEEHWDEVHP